MNYTFLLAICSRKKKKEKKNPTYIQNKTKYLSATANKIQGHV